MQTKTVLAMVTILLLSGCFGGTDGNGDPAVDDAYSTDTRPADLVLRGGRVYSLAWGEPDREGSPAADAPYDEHGWHPDGSAIAIRDGRIVFVGDVSELADYVDEATQIIDLDGATVLPGFIDSHAHGSSYGLVLGRVSLLGVEDEAEAVDRIAEAARTRPKGEWIVAWGFDEGKWSMNLPDNKLLSERVPDHPVHAVGLHGFASWNNNLSLDMAGITAATESPTGGRIVLDKGGRPTGILLDNATDLYADLLPEPTLDDRIVGTGRALQSMADLGYVAIHDAGVDGQALAAYQELERRDSLPIRVYAMLSITDTETMADWIAKGPSVESESFLTVRSVKAYYDASLGARGARMLEEYDDRPGHFGVSGGDYGFDRVLARQVMEAGFQLCIHAIGDAGNRETLDFFSSVYAEAPGTRAQRNRIEHAQIVHPDDQSRFAELDVIASMEPPHAVEDMAWAEARIGSRAAYGYAWRSLRRQGARLAFNSDLSGSDPNLFYGLHAAITRRDKDRQPADGWFPEQSMTPEEAIRGYTTWNAFAGFTESETGVLASGRWADLTVLDIDPFVVGTEDPGKLLGGTVLMTVVAGKVIYRHGDTDPVPALYTNPLQDNSTR